MPTINIFEGSRRIALLIKVLWVLAVIAYAYSQSPYTSITLFTVMPGDSFVAILDRQCDLSVDDVEFVTREFAPSRTVSVELCFQSSIAADGRRVIPFRLTDGGKSWLGNDKYTTDVMNYTSARAKAFSLSSENRLRAKEIWDQKQGENLRYAFLFVVGGWIALSLLQAIIGWIVRGFLGIPWRQDRRPEAASPTA